MKATLKSEKITVFKNVPILSMSTEFAVNDNSSIAPIEGWTSERPTVTGKQVLWQRIVISYKDGTVEYMTPTPAGENGKAYAVYISSSNGTSLTNGKLSTTLACSVLLNGINITDDMVNDRFSWHRESESSVSDAEWNKNEKLGGTKEISITETDCIGHTTFFCSVLIEENSSLDAIISIDLNLNMVLVQYQYGSSDRTPPSKLTIFKRSGVNLFFKKWLLVDNEYTDWVDNALDLTRDASKIFLWMRVSTDKGYTWKYSLISGPPVSFFEIKSSKSTYRLNSRGVVDEEDAITFWSVLHNISNEKHIWTVEPASLLEYEQNSNLDLSATNLNIIIPVGYSGGYVKVSLKIGDSDESVSLTLYGEKTGDALPQKQPLVYGEQNLPTVAKDGVSPLIEGDYCLVEYPDGERIPFRYSPKINPNTGQIYGWQRLDGSEDNASEILGNVLSEALEGANTVSSVSAIYGFFKNLTANTAFIKFLCAQYLEITGAIYGGDYNEHGELTKDNGVGFHISKDGKLSAISAYLINAIVSGMFHCYDSSGDILRTSYFQQGQTYTNINSSSPTHFMLNAVSSVTFISNEDGITSIKRNSFLESLQSENRGLTLIHCYPRSPNHTIGSVTIKKDITVRFNTNLMSSGAVYGIVYVNGKEVWSIRSNSIRIYNSWYSTISYNLKAGDVISFGGYGEKERQNINIYQTGFFGFGEKITYRNESENWYIEDYNLIFTEPLDTNLMVRADSVSNPPTAANLYSLNGFSIIADGGYNLTSDSFVLYYGEKIFASSFVKDSSNVTIYLKNGQILSYDITPNTNSLTRTGYAPIQYNFTIQSALRGVYVASLLPASSDATFGSASNVISEIWAKNCFVDSLKINELPTSSDNLATGQVWNDNGTLKIKQ